MRLARFGIRAAALAGLVASIAACGGTTQFAGSQPFQIAGTPPPPPPKVAEAPKPPPRVELRDNKIVFAEKIQFEVNKAIIKEESFSLLHDIADVIKKNPQVKKIEIDGFASAEGDAGHNKKLSDDRAHSVMDHLVKKEGIDASRLQAKGWGVEKPIASNDTEEGREKNRRVEFNVIEQVVTEKKVEIDPATGKERVVSEDQKEQQAPADTSTSTTTATTPAKPATATTAKPATTAKAATAKTPAASGTVTADSSNPKKPSEKK